MVSNPKGPSSLAKLKIRLREGAVAVGRASGTGGAIPQEARLRGRVPDPGPLERGPEREEGHDPDLHSNPGIRGCQQEASPALQVQRYDSPCFRALVPSPLLTITSA